MRDEFKITRQGKQYVLFAGLLDEAHSRGIRGIDTQLLQVPDEANGSVAIVKALVEMAEPTTGEIRYFGGIGDASPQNVSRSMANALIRMAETRAKARALRDAVNIGATALEELSGEEGASTGNASSTADASKHSGSRMRAVQGGTKQGSAEGHTPSPPEPEPSDGGYGGADIAGQSSAKARKSQVDLLKALAEELRGSRGVEKLQERIGKPLSELSREEADAWIDRLSPQEEAGAASASAETAGGQD